MDFSTGKYIAVRRTYGMPKIGVLNAQGQVVSESGEVIYQIHHFDVLDGAGVRVGRMDGAVALTDDHCCIFATHEG